MSLLYSLIIRPSSETGSIAPISLFTYITDTRMVSSLSDALSVSGSTCPAAFTGRYVTSKPFFSRNAQLSSTAGCSITVVIMCLPRLLPARAAPIIAILSPSVPPDVKKISFSLTLRIPAKISLASRR